jgi:aromatic ring-opening dioxygenase LigB subunit
VAAVAVCPHPPLLVPEIASGAAPELDTLRTACDEAVRRLIDADPSVVLVIGAGGTTRRYGPSSYGDFAGYGVPRVRVGFGRHNCAGASELPLGLLVGAWLLGRAGYRGLRFGHAVAEHALTDECLAVGRDLVVSDSPVGLLVMGDGSARRTEKAPGHYDERAARFDEDVAAALASADLDALAKLDPGLADELLVAGRAPWQVLAGAAAGRDWSADLLYHDAPYGVGYFVVSWTAS